MKLRCELHLGNHSTKLLLVPKPEEKLDHLALKLAAYTMFHQEEPIVEPSSEHPALLGFDLKPDVMVLDEAGEIKIWIECGPASLNKLDKVTRRFTQARIVVLKAQPREALRQRDEVTGEIRHGTKIEIWAWPDGMFQNWLGAVEEKSEVFGEAHEKSMNLVLNHTPIAVDMIEV